MRAAVIIFPGSNCDRDLLSALRFAGHETISFGTKKQNYPKILTSLQFQEGFLSGIILDAVPSLPSRPFSKR